MKTEYCREIPDIISEAVFLHNPEDGRIIDVNAAMLNMFGYSRKELETITLKEISAGQPPFNIDEAQKKIQKAINEGPQLFEWLCRKKDGELFWGEVDLRMKNAGDSAVAIAVVRDITGRKTKEEEVLKKTAELEAYFMNSLDLQCIIDVEGRFHRLNPTWGKVLGYSMNEMEGRRYIDLVHPEDRASTEVIAGISSQKEIQNFTNRYRCKDNSYRWIEWRSFPVGDMIFATARDITERKNAEDELKNAYQKIQQSEQKYRLLFENMTSGFALHEMLYDENGNPDDYRYIEVNPAFERLTGIPAASLIGRTVKEVMPNTEKYWIDTYGKVAMTGIPISYQNYSSVLQRYYDAWAFSPEKNRFAVIFNDITERRLEEIELDGHRRHLEELVKERTTELEILNALLQEEIEKQKEGEVKVKLALQKEKELNNLKTKFISIASHEFRTPLTTIFSSTELLERYGREWNPEMYAKITDKIKKSVGYLTDLMDDVLIISRTETGKIQYAPRPVEIEIFCNSILEEIKVLLTEKHKLDYDFRSTKKQLCWIKSYLSLLY